MAILHFCIVGWFLVFILCALHQAQRCVRVPVDSIPKEYLIYDAESNNTSNTTGYTMNTSHLKLVVDNSK